MKFDTEMLMTLQHVEDMAATTGGSYDDMVNAAFAAVLHIMVIGNRQDLNAVIVDIQKLCEHYVGRCEAVMAENLSNKRTLH